MAATHLDASIKLILNGEVRDDPILINEVEEHEEIDEGNSESDSDEIEEDE